MSGAVVANRVKRGFYADSVALMRIARELSALEGVQEASLMIGSPSNKAILGESGLLAGEGRGANPDDLVIAVRAKSAAAAQAALDAAEARLEKGDTAKSVPGLPRARGLDGALALDAEANLALLSVPGDFAAAEARKALERGLHVMMFSDNVSLEDEIALKDLALERGLLMMGPDCGTSHVAGTPLAFANEVPRGDIGLVSASGTGLQEVMCLVARHGGGVSHGIGVGGRDLSREVGARMTLAAFDALEADAATRVIVLVSKPPAPEVAEKVFTRVARSKKPVVLCLLGASALRPPKNAVLATTLHAAAMAALGRRATLRAPKVAPRAGWLRGLFCGGTLCAEAQLVLRARGLALRSNVPVPGVEPCRHPDGDGHVLIDLGDDDYTRGRPHPMIDPALRGEWLERALAERGVSAILLDVVIGHGAHADPAGLIAASLARVPKSRARVIASVTGTDADPQRYAAQVATLRAAGVVVAESNAAAALAAAAALGSAKGPAAARTSRARKKAPARRRTAPRSGGTKPRPGDRSGRAGVSRRGRR